MSHLIKGEKERRRVNKEGGGRRKGRGSNKAFLFCSPRDVEVDPKALRPTLASPVQDCRGNAWADDLHLLPTSSSSCSLIWEQCLPLAHSLIFTPPSLILPPHFILSHSVHVARLFAVQYYMPVLSGLSSTQQICITCMLENAKNTTLSSIMLGMRGKNIVKSVLMHRCT